jgi:excisionase family DNA binding protein
VSVEIPTALVRGLAEAVAEIVAERLRSPEPSSPWMTKEEARVYMRLEPGTFDKMVSDGRIPSHGSPRVRLFHRSEVDAAVMRDYAPALGPTALRRAS